MRFILILVCLLTLRTFTSAQTIPAPTQVDSISIDNGTPLSADPNDRIRYKVTIQNTGGSPATNVQLNAVPDPRTTLVPGSFRTSPLALDDAYASTGNVGLNVPVGAGLKANDFDDNLALATVTAGTFATTQSGSVMIAADGSFTYTPPAGFTGTDTYVYTLNDGNHVPGVVATSTATVTFTVSNLIWFIDNSAPAGDGRLGTPFNSLAAFNAGSAAAADVVYIEQTGTDYTAGIVLQNGERLFGEGHTGGANLANVLPFSLAPNSKTLPNINGLRPIITNAAGDGVGVAQNNILRGFDVGSCSDFGMENLAAATVGTLTISEVAINNTSGGGIKVGNGGVLAVTFSSISSSGGVNGINLSGSCTGSFVGGTGAISNPSGAAFLISGGTAAVDYNGTLSKTGTSSGRLVDIQTHATGLISLDGNLTNTATGATGIFANANTSGTISFNGASKTLTTAANGAVTFTSNTGTTINFTAGGLVINTTSGGGYSATGGGTVNVTGTTNTITSTTGTALNVANTTIGASNLNFLSISANGAANGIVLNTTGASGGLSVTGTGTTNGSGGTIQNITNRGVSATSTLNLSLKNITFTNANTTDGAPCGAADNSGCNAAIYLNTVTNATLDNTDINGTAQQGINLREVNGFTLNGSTIINGGAGGQTEEADFYALNLFGTCAITNSSLTVPAERAAVIYNTSKTMALTVNASTFGMNQTQPLGADGLEISSFGASNTTIDVIASTFIQPKTNGLQVITEGTSVSDVDIQTSTFDPGTGLAAAIDLDVNNTANMKFNIVNNPMIKGKGINIVNIFAFPSATFEGRINSNTVVNNGGSGAGIRVFSQGNGNSKVEIKNNTVTGGDDYGIDVTCQLGTGRLDATITGNTASVTALGFYVIHALAGNSGSVNTNKVCANVANNTTTAAAGAIGNFQARSATAGHEILLQGGGGTVAANWSANTNTPVPGLTSQSGTGVFTFGATCAIPANPIVSP
ncbi:MAG: cadherin-like domain-containing protein [Saprospiraceae bacterium]|uniref:Cadherin-like domain-containing protein n=1 Tax=Candidatus Opimibacter skivensis TaxID=2982028 RepID=A0A9D7STR0_9BACT|nr:cadherin-like domain-containing protein [Candidatus Opimibacter skivensis]